MSAAQHPTHSTDTRQNGPGLASSGPVGPRKRSLAVHVTATLGTGLSILFAATMAWSGEQPQAASGSRTLPVWETPVSASADAEAEPATDMSLCPETVCRPTVGLRGFAGLSGPPLSAIHRDSTRTRLMRVGKQSLGLRLLEGFYATIGLRPIQVVDPASADRSPTDRVDLGVVYVVNF